MNLMHYTLATVNPAEDNRTIFNGKFTALSYQPCEKLHHVHAQRTRRGRETHPRDQCPARDAECYKCKKKGHCEALYGTKATAANVEADDMMLDTAFLANLIPQDRKRPGLHAFRSKATNPFRTRHLCWGHDHQ